MHFMCFEIQIWTFNRWKYFNFKERKLTAQVIKIEILTSKNFPINARTILSPLIIQKRVFWGHGISLVSTTGIAHYGLAGIF